MESYNEKMAKKAYEEYAAVKTAINYILESGKAINESLELRTLYRMLEEADNNYGYYVEKIEEEESEAAKNDTI